jgi:hypothetical protein
MSLKILLQTKSGTIKRDLRSVPVIMHTLQKAKVLLQDDAMMYRQPRPRRVVGAVANTDAFTEPKSIAGNGGERVQLAQDVTARVHPG